jgi:hypothetical protein
VSEMSETVDQKVLELRGQGRGYAQICRDLGLDRTADAQQAFRRALLGLPEVDAARVRGEELSRLERLAGKVREDATRNEVDRERQLKAIKRMRAHVRDDS